MSKPIAFLTNDTHSQFFKDDLNVIPHLELLNLPTKPLVWTQVPIDQPKQALAMLQKFQAIIIRSPWDYHSRFTQFLNFLKFCKENQIKLLNPYEILIWNLNKHYLDELELNQIPCIPTIWTQNSNEFSKAEELMRLYKTIIFKPAVSAGSANTFKLTQENINDHKNIMFQVMNEKECMFQPYLESIETIGELSLIYFAGNFSHAIVKKPKTGDFRVQDKFGGSIEAIQPDQDAMNIANKCIQYIESKFTQKLLYTRIDLVHWKKNWVIIEAECVEPQLYFQYGIGSAKVFANLINQFTTITS